MRCISLYNDYHESKIITQSITNYYNESTCDQAIVLQIFYCLFCQFSLVINFLKASYLSYNEKLSNWKGVEARETEIARHGRKSQLQRETAKLGEKCQHIFDVKIVVKKETPAVVDFPLRSCPFCSKNSPRIV